MAHPDTLAQAPRAALFDMLGGVRAGMLGLSAAGDGSRPMTHFPDPLAGVIWFISSTETDLVQSLGMGEEAEYIVISEDHDIHSSLRGKLYQVHDDARLDALWSPIVGAWFEGGREDPRVALLRFDPEVATLWASSTSALKLGFEMIRGDVDPNYQPDLGVKATVRFPTDA